MEGRNLFMALGIYLCLGLLLVLTACGALYLYRMPSPVPSGADEGEESPTVALRPMDLPPPSRGDSAVTDQLEEQLRLQRELLEERNRSLEEVRAQLAETENRLDELQREFDDMLDITGQLLIAPTVTDSSDPMPNLDPAGRTELAAEPGDGVAADGTAESAESDELTRLREQLANALLEQLALEAQLRSLTDQQESEQSIAAALNGAGIAAVPLLMEALTDADAAVRVWAAASLGELGEGAALALTDLREARRDEDPRVREAADRAIQRIQDAVGG